VSAAANQLYKQPAEDNTWVRNATNFHPLVLNHDKSLLEQKNYGKNCVKQFACFFSVLYPSDH
jgi:hypothetical protein